MRGYQNAVSLFLAYVTESCYGWDEVCQRHFGTYPVQVFHEWDTAAHRSETEARPGNRPLSREELQAFFDHCDAGVTRTAKSGRKGWLAAFRDATLFKVAYGWGLRRREASKLDTVDWSANAAAPEFGRYGALSVRFGKAMRGSPPRRRTVLTTMGWAAEAVAEWMADIRPLYRLTSAVLWPTERGGRVSVEHINARFAAYRDALGLDKILSPHCPRHSYVTHLLEDGFDHLFVQQRAGHSWGRPRPSIPARAGSGIHAGPAGRSEMREGARRMARSRALGYQWHLRTLMANRGMFSTTDLAPLLAERGVELSAAQVYRLVAQTPERLSLRTLVALCDILGCTPADLIEPVVEATRQRATGTDDGGAVEVPAAVRQRRPRRADIRRAP